MLFELPYSHLTFVYPKCQGQGHANLNCMVTRFLYSTQQELLIDRTIGKFRTRFCNVITNHSA